MPEAFFNFDTTDWRVTSLGELCAEGGGNIQTGPFGSQLHASDYVAEGIPSIMPKNIGDNRIVEEGIARITEADAKRLSRYRVKTGDVVYSRRGDVRRRALIRKEHDGWLCGTGCLRVRVGSADNDASFVSHYLGHPDVMDWIESNAVGSTMPNLNTAILSRLPIVVPSPDEQRAIARVLDALDDKIELNRRMNRTLEELASMLFRSWFVDFDPVMAKAAGRKPAHLRPELAALFPDSFQDSALGPIPRGWRIASIGEIAVNPRRITDPHSIEATTPYIGLEHMPRKSICLCEWGTAADACSAKSGFQQGEILFGKLRPYFHKVGIALTNGVCSTDVLVISRSTETWFGVLAGHLSSQELIDYTDAASGGTKMPRTNWNDIKRYQIVLPPERLAEELSKWYRQTAEMLAHNVRESRTLAALRDTLLPKLLSGEVRVKQAEKIVSASV
jgi:type I restriction enzyme S subunit